MSHLRRGKIRHFVHGVYDGPHATPPEADDGPIFLGIKNVTPDGRLDLSEIRHVSERDFPRWTKRVVPQQDDIVFSYEATLHRYARIPAGFRGCLGRRMALVRPKPELVDPRFLHMYFLSRQWRTQVEANIISGATVDRIPLTRFPDFEVVLPPLEEQRRVADIINTYDRLIENNHRRIQLLEESARLLYREWFVHLRFPGHEHVKVVDGIPEKWELRSAEELCHVFRGRSYRSDELVETGGQDFINLKCVDRGGGFRTEGIKKFRGEHKKTHVAGPGSIVLAVTDMTRDRLVIGEAARVPSTVSDDAVISMDLVRVSPFPGVEEKWFYFMLRYSHFAAEVKEKASGTNVLHLNPRHVQEQKVILPTQSLRREFSDTVRPILQQVDCLRAANEKLAQARNLLLPRLMNGEIAV